MESAGSFEYGAATTGVRSQLRTGVKIGLARGGARLPERLLYVLDAALNYLWVGWWMRRRGFQPRHQPRTRTALFDLIADAVEGAKVVYLEFGVGAGNSMRYWSRRLVDPTSELHGFDSFQGLPNDWVLGRPAGCFSTGGRPPAIRDPRIAFHVGWFHETVPTFELPASGRLVVNIDADLYRSCVTVLEYLRDKIAPGDFLYFDEFNHRSDELRAFDEFLADTGLVFRLFAATPTFAHVAFEAAERQVSLDSGPRSV